MRTPVFALPLLLCLPLTAFAQDTVSREDHQLTVNRLHRTEQIRRELQTSLSQLRLQQLAMVVHYTSQGKSSLLLNAGVSATPTLGRIVQKEDGGNPPYITLYPASSPRAVVLPGLGECRLLGVAQLSVMARLSVRGDHCLPGSYLMALPTGGNGAKTLSLLDVQANERGEISYRPVLQIPIEPLQADSAPSLNIKAAFPDRNTVSQDHPAWQVKAELTGVGIGARFYLNMDITML